MEVKIHPHSLLVNNAMKIGLQIVDFAWAGGPEKIGPTLGAIARRAEEAGFDSLWLMDHFFQVPALGDVADPMLEAYTTLGFIAGQTSRIELGVMVTGVTYRHPGVLLKTVTTLDVLSGGRAWLGLGTGWFEREHVGLGVPLPPLKERFERLEETLQIAHLMWSGEVAEFNGKHYKLNETLNSPPPIRNPQSAIRNSHPPLLVGGSGETKTLRLVAKYADACNFFARHGDEWLKHKLDVLRAHCEAEGRLYEEISKTVIADQQATREPSGVLSAQRVVDHAAHLAALGFDYFHLSIPNVDQASSFGHFQHEIIPAIHRL
ncbi:MAG: LLM class F420-dependent oxidoreductase [Chloroflexia bacterium]